jgi:hypothetical protein
MGTNFQPEAKRANRNPTAFRVASSTKKSLDCLLGHEQRHSDKLFFVEGARSKKRFILQVSEGIHYAKMMQIAAQGLVF